MGKDDPRVRVGESDGTDQTPLDVAAVRLLVDVQRGGFVATQDPGGNPLTQRVPGAGVPTRGGALVDVTGKDQPDDVVGMRGLQRRDPGIVDHVVRRGGSRRQVGTVTDRVPQCPERREDQPVGRRQDRIGSTHARIVWGYQHRCSDPVEQRCVCRETDQCDRWERNPVSGDTGRRSISTRRPAAIGVG